MGIYAYLKNDKKTIYFTAIVANKKTIPVAWNVFLQIMCLRPAAFSKSEGSWRILFYY